MVEKILKMADESPDFSSSLVLSGCSESMSAFLGQDNEVGDKSDSDHASGDEEDEALVESCNDVKPPHRTFNSWGPFDTPSDGSACLNSLVKGFERILMLDSQTKWCVPSYNRVQSAFAAQVAGGDLDALEPAVKRATAQMQVLLTEVSGANPARALPFPSAKLIPRPSLSKRATTKFPRLPTRASRFSDTQPLKPTTGEKAPSTTPSMSSYKTTKFPSLPTSSNNTKPSKPPAKPTKGKDAFGACMTVWLMHNFTNPYPDEVMLKSLAHYLIVKVKCIKLNPNDADILKGKTPEEIACARINNWLVNARTRKWRPAIEDAFNAKRPAALLLEDSIRTLGGEELRPIDYWDGKALFASHPKYSIPLKEWKKGAYSDWGRRNVTTDVLASVENAMRGKLGKAIERSRASACHVSSKRKWKKPINALNSDIDDKRMAAEGIVDLFTARI